MRLLLDTHVLISLLSEDPSVTEELASALRDPGNAVVVSAASAWEISIKKSSGKLDAPDDLEDQIERNRLTSLAITVAHGVAAGQLPPVHGDPFDRVLVAQAQLEHLTLVTRDRTIARYDVDVLRA